MNISVYANHPYQEVRNMWSIAMKNIPQHSLKYVRATVDKDFVDRIIAGMENKYYWKKNAIVDLRQKGSSLKLWPLVFWEDPQRFI